MGTGEGGPSLLVAAEEKTAVEEDLDPRGSLHDAEPVPGLGVGGDPDAPEDSSGLPVPLDEAEVPPERIPDRRAMEEGTPIPPDQASTLRAAAVDDPDPARDLREGGLGAFPEAEARDISEVGVRKEDEGVAAAPADQRPARGADGRALLDRRPGRGESGRLLPPLEVVQEEESGLRRAAREEGQESPEEGRQGSSASSIQCETNQDRRPFPREPSPRKHWIAARPPASRGSSIGADPSGRRRLSLALPG